MLKKRLFWGFELDIKWPILPDVGRMIDPSSRHATVCFLGEQDSKLLKPYTSKLEIVNKRPISGKLNNIISLAHGKKARVLCFTGLIKNEIDALSIVNKIKADMRDLLGIKTEDRKWLFHVSFARAPFKSKNAIETIKKACLKDREEELNIDFSLKNLCLYQSLPALLYKKVYEYNLY